MKNFHIDFSDLGKKLNRAAADAKDWLIENRRVSIPAGIGIAALIVLCIVVSIVGKEPQEQLAMRAAETGGEIPVPEVPLEENAHAELNSLFSQYYEALAAGDTATLEELKSYMNDSEKLAFEKRSEYIEYYTNITCYTKPGPIEDSYVVYVYNEAKLNGFETLVPGINTFLVYQDEDGGYFIKSGEVDENVDKYTKQISLQEDVEELFTRVGVKYAEVEDSDPELKALLEEIPVTVKNYVAEEVAKQKGSATPETAEEEQETTETEAERQEEASAQAGQTVEVTDVVNIRSSDSETADKLGKAQTGDRFTLLENRGNGWSKIEFEGKEAFIKTQYLSVVDGQAASSGEGTGGTSSGSDAAAAQPEASSSTGETVTAKTTVNVRASANENGERLGTIYQGEKLELVMRQADGWTKVKYEGKTAYVKSDFVE